MNNLDSHCEEIVAVCPLPCNYDTICSMQSIIEARMGGDFDKNLFSIAASLLCDD
jgi:hypothetical protein